MAKKYDRIEFLGGTENDWLWCLHCERCYQLKDCREVPPVIDMGFGDLQMCHYEDCDGDTVMDAWDYSGEEPPEMNKVYPMYD